MAFADNTKRLAVLIDADNTSSKIADRLFEEVARLGEASVRRIYGDFSSPRMKGWTETLTRHAIVPQQQFAYTVGKNASDITLVIDAMDLLHTERFGGFCLVSSDSDFTRLASRIREQGADVYGFGEQKTPESFRQACSRFIYTENLSVDPPVERETKPAPPGSPPNAAVPIIKRVLVDIDSDDGWVALSTLGTRLSNLKSDFDSRTYGSSKLSDLVRKTGAFEVETAEGKAMRIRLRRKPSQN
ncbi:NYN domain-containing protein [Rhizobium glycinendophyticum]|uniref:NYN domain-containing protein n=1 Tax=Rhizobium glycinendophyticum TaxID=2589807 RepID=A0A504UAU7_9HYPH|nr:NYN domain-containing protein [Rhizobium glycinendophyticum]TPP10707.1 NYN domain-containing protein [Rhizobium glycinendophyticum]